MPRKKTRKRGRSRGLLFILFGILILLVFVPLIKSHDTVRDITEERSENNVSADNKEVYVVNVQERPETSIEDVVSEDKIEEQHGALVALVIDDFGFSYSMAEEIAAIDLPFTWAIIPHQRFTEKTVLLAESKKIPYLVHMPMEALADKAQGDSLIGVSMSAPSVAKAVKDVFAIMPNAIGMNNHRGSKATSNDQIMSVLMETLAPMNKIFIDSRTSSKSVAYKTAQRFGVPSAYNSIFLDHETNIEFMRKQFQKAVTIAKKRGWVVAICHNRPDTIPFLQELCDSNINVVKFVTVPELLRIQKAQ